MRIVPVLIVASLALPGCKWKKEAERLQALADEQAETIRQHEATLAEREETIDDLEADVASLDARIEDMKESIAALESSLDEEREKSSRILADRGALREEVRDMKDALAELEARRREAEARVSEFRRLVDRFKPLIDAGKLEVRIVDGRMVVVLGSDILFASGSADLSEGGAEALTEVAGVLASIEERAFQVEGHTDDVPIRTSRYPSNWFLAAARAIGVVNHLVEAGMPSERVSAAAYGDTKPVASNETDEGRQQNRRIEIVVVPDLAGLPGYEELEAIDDE